MAYVNSPKVRRGLGTVHSIYTAATGLKDLNKAYHSQRVIRKFLNSMRLRVLHILFMPSTLFQFWLVEVVDKDTNEPKGFREIRWDFKANRLSVTEARKNVVLGALVARRRYKAMGTQLQKRTKEEGT